MYQTGNVDILTLKQLLGHSSVGTTQIYTHLQEFQVRAAIEQNPLGEVKKATWIQRQRRQGRGKGNLPILHRMSLKMMHRTARWKPLRVPHRRVSGWMFRALPIREIPNEPTRFFKGYSVWTLRFKGIPEVLKLYEKNQKLQLGCIDGTTQTERS